MLAHETKRDSYKRSGNVQAWQDLVGGEGFEPPTSRV
jgi:hypothetical protein